MAGLGGKTSHMMSASLMGMGRLLYEFMPQLQHLLPQLVPAVAELFKSKSRELIVSVLGFMKIVAMRAPLEQLLLILPEMLQGMLLWAEDSKNKFKLHVRMIVQRLAKRCGYDELEKHFPDKDKRLLSHIRQQQNRKTRKRLHAREEDGLELDFDIKSKRSSSKSMKKSEWGHTKVFEVEEDEEDAAIDGTVQVGNDPISMEDDEDPMDLQDIDKKKSLYQPSCAYKSQQSDRFAVDGSGKIVIEEDQLTGKKRSREGMDIDQDDSDFEDLKGIAGLKKAWKSTEMSGRMTGSVTTIKSQKSKSSRVSHHSGDRYKPKKKNVGGDAKGKAKLEPYSLDNT
eukprot:TRINITY_DN29293_c0_g1_i2.p1 TRINITY_DN29293_c0_g1~~TRINITY_DN29293_c0_g1_i2.p1  ORF type:complete len:370 (+),score=57.74 TRINITY_DN29293_c0_g1_i2:93-1112(+)